MKKIFLGILSFAFISAHSQTADEVIQKYTTAMGGLKAINAIKTAKMKGTFTIQGSDLPITTQIINGKAVRTDIELMGQTITSCYKDGKGWKINPFAGIETPTDVSGVELMDFKNQSILTNQLMDYKARGHKVELLGQEDIEGVKTYKIKLTNKDDGKTTTYYINTADNMLIKNTATREMQGQEIQIENYFSDIKDVSGLKFSMTRTQKVNGEVTQIIKMTSVEWNVPIDEKIFDKKLK